MKKLLFCIVILISQFAIQSYFSTCHADWSYEEYEETGDSVDCASECAGRNPSSDACNKCNNCEGRGSDDSVAKCRNPF